MGQERRSGSFFRAVRGYTGQEKLRPAIQGGTAEKQDQLILTHLNGELAARREQHAAVLSPGKGIGAGE